MDDFNVSALHESKNEWGSRLLTIFTPLIIDGFKSILSESIKLCKENGEMEKYLMTFQNLISRIPKWNSQIIETERKRIIEKSGCNYLEELITCVHIIQLKLLTAIRVGQKQKKIDINVPKLDEFIHKTYINVARKVYKNIYLFEIKIPSLQIQKNNRELEIIVQECVLNTLRESIPVETILKAYMDEVVEEEVTEEVKEEIIETPIIDNTPTSPSSNLQNQPPIANRSSINFNDSDYVQNADGVVETVNAPKTFERLEEISNIRAQQNAQQNNEDDDDDKICISDVPFSLGSDDVNHIEDPTINLLPDLLIDDIEILN